MQKNDRTFHTYITCFQNESIYIQKTHLFCDACVVYIMYIAKLQMRFLHYAFFLATSHVVSVPFSWPFFGNIFPEKFGVCVFHTNND